MNVSVKRLIFKEIHFFLWVESGFRLSADTSEVSNSQLWLRLNLRSYFQQRVKLWVPETFSYFKINIKSYALIQHVEKCNFFCCCCCCSRVVNAIKTHGKQLQKNIKTTTATTNNLRHINIVSNRRKTLLHNLKKCSGCSTYQYPDLVKTIAEVFLFFIFFFVFIFSKFWDTNLCIPRTCHSMILFGISLVLLYCGVFFHFLGL